MMDMETIMAGPDDQVRANIVQQMLTRVPAEAVAATKGKQVPWSNSPLLREVYLAEK